jgi:DNA-binding transcriptional MerR regulator
MTARDVEHLSIGEVLAELSDEFPDITISKIRFLESQGLVDPERTPSGYRKFQSADLTRLRWILYQQKEHFLPLKVIKERLDALAPGTEEQLFATDAPASAAPAEADAEAATPVEGAPASPARQAEAAASGQAPAGGDAPPRPVRARSTRGPRTPTFAPTLPADPEADAPVTGRVGEAHHTRAELAAAAGIDVAQVRELESYGLLAPVWELDGDAEFDDDAIDVAGIARGFFARGIEPRHLRMYRTFAEREAVLFGQVLMPYVRQRNPEARARLEDELGELAGLGRRLRTALLRGAVRETLAE